MPWLLAIVAALTVFSVHASDRGVSNAALARAAREARLDQIDDFRNHCHDSRRVEDWLKDVVGATAKSVRWSGVPFAFRAVADTKDGPDYMRETYAFEVNWKQMHVPGYAPPVNQDCD